MAKAHPSLAYKFVINEPYRWYWNRTGSEGFDSLEKRSESPNPYLLNFALTANPNKSPARPNWRTFNDSDVNSEMWFGFGKPNSAGEEDFPPTAIRRGASGGCN